MSETDVKEKAEKTVTELIDAALDGKLSGKFDGIAKMSDVEAKLKQVTDILKPKETEKAEKAEMKEEGIAAITKAEAFGIPFGQIAIGTFGGIGLGELTRGFLAAQSGMIQGVAQLALVAVINTWGKRWMSSDARLAISIVLGSYGLSQIIPIDKWAQRLAGQIRGILPGTIKVVESNPLRQAERVAENYYARLGGAR